MNLLRAQQRIWRNRVIRACIRPTLPISARPDLKRLGTHYGGWWVPTSLLGQKSIVYSVGVGGDASFDLALIEGFGCSVWGFDPTPFSQQYVRSRDWPPQWHFEEVGIWTESGRVRFQPPAGRLGGSASITRPGNQQGAFLATVEDLPTIMARLGHDHINLLKMDIEGAEGPVIDQLVENGIRPDILCVEYDQPEAPHRLVARVRRLLRAGYVLNKVETWNYTFTRHE